MRHNEDYFHLLGWNLFLTNAPQEQLPLATAAKLYRLRWRVELIFKAWKSHLGRRQLSKVGQPQVEVLVYGLLLCAVLLHQSIPLASAAATAAAFPQQAPPLSLLRVAQFFGSWLLILLLAELEPSDLHHRLRAQFDLHCRYDRRRRNNYANLHASLLS